MHKVEFFILRKKLLNQLVKHARKNAPKESVSLISGKIIDNKAYAKKVYTPENIDNSTVSFTVNPHVLLDIYNDIERDNLQMIGIYHTHPAPPYPSGTDIHYMEVNFCVWLISSIKNPANPKGYLLHNNNLKEITIKITD